MELYLHSRIRLHGVVLNQLSTKTTLPLPFMKPFIEKRDTRDDEIDSVQEDTGYCYVTPCSPVGVRRRSVRHSSLYHSTLHYSSMHCSP
jgi:hypothetical protein